MSAGITQRLVLLGSARAPGGVFYGLNGQTITGDANGAWAIVANGTNQGITLTPSGTGRVIFAGLSEARDTVHLGTNGSFGNITWNTTAVQIIGKATYGVQLFTNNNTTTPAIYCTTGQETLFGTTTNSSNGRIQLASHTTSAGGIGLGSDLSWYRAGAGAVALSSSGDTVLNILAGAKVGGFKVASVSGQLELYANGTLGLTLDSSQNATFAGSATVASTGRFAWAARGSIAAAADGVFLMRNEAASDFSRLQFGGTTSSFPALKRSGANLQLVTADDTEYRGLSVSNLTLNSSGAVYGWLEGAELTGDPAAPAADKFRLFAKDNGAGKTQLYVIFATGAAQLIATEP